MSELAQTPEPPYYAVVFSSTLKEQVDGYSAMGDLMVELAQKQEGFLGIETARNEIGITVSYWKDLESIKKWKEVSDHKIAQQKGYQDWYNTFKVRISKVERDYGFEAK